MKLKIAELRKKKKISQEELAEVLNVSRQAISKWEQGESYPDLDLVAELANYFNVSIDYLLGFDISAKSVNEFTDMIFEAIRDYQNNIDLEDIKSYVSRYPNNFNLLASSVFYMLDRCFSNINQEMANLIVEYGKKALMVFEEKNKLETKKEDICKCIILGYFFLNRFDLAKQFIEEHKIDNVLALAECEFELRNYDKANNLVSDLYLDNISSLINCSLIQIRILLATNKIVEAMELTNWCLNFVRSISIAEDSFKEAVIVFTIIKIICQKHLGMDIKEDIEFCKNKYQNMNNSSDTDNIKYYYGGTSIHFFGIKDIKSLFDREKEMMDSSISIYPTFVEIIDLIFGGINNE